MRRSAPAVTLSTKPPPPDAPDGRRMRWWRERVMRITQQQLAALLGIERRAIQRLEDMAIVPEVYRLACQALDESKTESAHWPFI